MKHEQGNSKAGYLLVEILIALFVIVILVTIGALILNISNGARSRAENFGKANSVAFAKIQEYELKDFAAIPVGNSSDDYLVEDFSDEVEASPDNNFKNVAATMHSRAISGSLKLVWLKLYYEFGSGGFTVDYATYMQIDGVGR